MTRRGRGRCVGRRVDRSKGIWRYTLGNHLRQRTPSLARRSSSSDADGLFADQISPYAPTWGLSASFEGIKKSSPPCIHALGCPASHLRS